MQNLNVVFRSAINNLFLVRLTSILPVSGAAQLNTSGAIADLPVISAMPAYWIEQQLSVTIIIKIIIELTIIKTNTEINNKELTNLNLIYLFKFKLTLDQHELLIFSNILVVPI